MRSEIESPQGGSAMPPTEVGFSRGFRNYTLFILALGFVVNVVDRNILTILMQPIKNDLGLSDSQLGFLSGIAFAIFYSTLGVPIAIWADRSNRRNIIALALIVFSGMTALCSVVVSFAQLALVRIGVAAGEAGTGAPSHSIISDMFPREKRAFALGIYTFGHNIGILIGFLVGGWVSQWYGWRMTFLVVGIPGLILSLIVRFTLKEPPRGHADGLTRQGEGPIPGTAEVLHLLWSQRSFRYIVCGTSFTGIAGASSLNWFPAFLSRSYQMSSGEIGTVLALIIGFVGGTGTLSVGYLADRLGAKDVRWYVWLIAILNIVSVPFWAALYILDSKTLTLILFLYPAFVLAAYTAPSISMTQALVGVRMRSRASAICYLMMSLLGGLGPLFTGMLSDFYQPIYAQQSLRYAMLTMSSLWILAALFYFLASRTLKADIDRVRNL